MKKFALHGMLLALGILLAACGSNAPTAKPANTPANVDFNEFLTLVNQFRSQPQVCKNGAADENMPAVGPVAYNDALNTSARLHSEDMANNNYFDHDSQDGTTFSQRNTNAGYTGFSTGENIAAGGGSAQAAFNQWRSSTSGHCQGLMSANSNEIGLGYGFNANSDFTHYWTFVSGRRN